MPLQKARQKQSKRSILPQVSDVVTFAQAVKMAENCQIKLLPYECADGMEKTKRLIENITPGQTSLFLSVRRAALIWTN